MRLRSMMVRTVDISLMLFIIHHPTICSQVPRPARTYVSIVSYRSNTPSSKNNLTSWLNNHWVSQHMTLESRSGGRIKFCFFSFLLALRRSTPGLTESPLSLFARFAFHWCRPFCDKRSSCDSFKKRQHFHFHWCRPFCDKRSSCDSFKKRQHRLILEGWYQIKFQTFFWPPQIIDPGSSNPGIWSLCPSIKMMTSLMSKN